MKTNPLKQTLAARRPTLGIWSLMPSPMVAESLAWGGMDFIIHDMEHGNFDPVAIDACVRATEAAGASPLVRIPGLNQSAAQWALDSGAHGIIVPQVDGVEEAEYAARLAKFPPLGTRGYNPFVRAGHYAGTRGEPHSKLHNDFPLACVIVETKRSLDELDRICALPLLDVIYVGVFDLSVALGFDGDVAHPDLQEIVKNSVGRITQAGKTAGLMVQSPDDMKRAITLGARFLLAGVDTHMMRMSAAKLVDACKGEPA